MHKSTIIRELGRNCDKCSGKYNSDLAHRKAQGRKKGKLQGKEAILVAKVTAWVLRKVKKLIHTITADNGKEFVKHEEIAQKLEINFYFCKPYHSWERGANENINGLIR